MATEAQSKQDRRAALISPYAKDKEASVQRAMNRGTPPQGLPALIAWFRECIALEPPTTVHKRELWRDYGHDGDGGSKLGTRAWSEPFRRFIEAVDHPSKDDGDDHFRFPMRAAIARWSRRPNTCLSAQYMYQLALVDGDWRRLADNLSYPHEFMSAYLETMLYRLWREYSDVRLRT